jgi:hypothetical protein
LTRSRWVQLLYGMEDETDRLIFTGWLEKRGKIVGFTTWKRRFFELDGSRLHYRKQRDASEGKSMTLSALCWPAGFAEPNSNQLNVFKAIGIDDSILFLRAER